MAKGEKIRSTAAGAANNAVLVTEDDATITGPAPGSSIGNNDYTFEDLGDLMTFDPSVTEEDEEGTGEHMTVLCDYLTGSKGKPYFKGMVVRLSKLVHSYNNDDDTKALVLRLLQSDSVRKATREEISSGMARVTMETETPEVRRERGLRMQAEAEAAMYKKRLELVLGNAIPPAQETGPQEPPSQPQEPVKEAGAADAGLTDEDWGEGAK